jgi:acyl carrier protein
MDTVHDSLTHELRSLIVENLLFGQADDQLTDEDSFLEKGIIDSTGVLELVGLLEQRYSIKVDDDDLIPDNLDSIGGLRRFVESKLGRTKPQGVSVCR